MATLNAKNLSFTIVPWNGYSAEDQIAVEKLADFFNSRSYQWACSTDGEVAVHYHTQMRLRNWHQTIVDVMGSGKHLTQTKRSPMPDEWAMQLYSRAEEDIPEDKIVRSAGQVFERMALVERCKEICRSQRNKSLYAKMACKTATAVDLASAGVVSPLSIHHAEESIKRIQAHERDKNRNPDLMEPITLTFQHYGDKGPTGLYPPVDVVIEPVINLNPFVSKRRHYCIYSSVSNFGKSYHLDRLVEHYNASKIGDLKNWTKISLKTQLLLIEEYGRNKRFKFEDLKALTSGNSRDFSGNRKSHGDSFEFERSDVQTIMVGNESIYEVHAEFDPKTQCRILASDVLDQINSRFHVICLDGDVEKEVKKFLGPSKWTGADVMDLFQEELLQKMDLEHFNVSKYAVVHQLTDKYVKIWRQLKKVIVSIEAYTDELKRTLGKNERIPNQLIELFLYNVEARYSPYNMIKMTKLDEEMVAKHGLHLVIACPDDEISLAAEMKKRWVNENVRKVKINEELLYSDHTDRESQYHREDCDIDTHDESESHSSKRRKIYLDGISQCKN